MKTFIYNVLSILVMALVSAMFWYAALAVGQDAKPYSFQADPTMCESRPKPEHCNDPEMGVMCWCSDLTKSCDWYCVVRPKN